MGEGVWRCLLSFCLMSSDANELIKGNLLSKLVFIEVCVCGVGGGGIIYLSLHSHHQNDFCIKVGSHFNVSLIVRDKVTRQCPQTTTFEEKGQPKQIRTEVHLLTNLTARPKRLTNNNCPFMNHFYLFG